LYTSNKDTKKTLHKFYFQIRPSDAKTDIRSARRAEIQKQRGEKAGRAARVRRNQAADLKTKCLFNVKCPLPKAKAISFVCNNKGQRRARLAMGAL
jgi:hypothetical protein